MANPSRLDTVRRRLLAGSAALAGSSLLAPTTALAQKKATPEKATKWLGPRRKTRLAFPRQAERARKASAITLPA